MGGSCCGWQLRSGCCSLNWWAEFERVIGWSGGLARRAGVVGWSSGLEQQAGVVG